MKKILKLTKPEVIDITGWDFSPLTSSGRMKETPLPWDLREIVLAEMKGVNRMLDMGTGGGEFLSSLAPLPENTIATENYEPNVKLAQLNLEPLGVEVVSGFKDDHLPFENNYFDLIINRHEYYNAGEVYRILKPGGKFITQQVQGNCDSAILKIFGRQPEADKLNWKLDKAAEELTEKGFTILTQTESKGFTSFRDSEAVISYLKVINWLVPGFNELTHSNEIIQISAIIKQNSCLNSELDRFLLIAEK